MNHYDIFGNYIIINKPTNNKNIENFADLSSDVKQAVNQIYQADIDSIRNLSNVANKLQTNGLNMQGHLAVSGRASVGTPDTPGAYPDWLSLSVNNNTDSHIRLKTKNDDNKNVYLINRDGHFRVNTHNVGDMLQLNRDGHFYTRHTGDHVAHHEGDGNHPYISLGKTGTWNNQKIYLQNVNAHTDDPTFRIGVHAKDPLMDINRNNTTISGALTLPNGWRLSGDSDALRVYKNNNQVFHIRNDGHVWSAPYGGYISDWVYNYYQPRGDYIKVDDPIKILGRGDNRYNHFVQVSDASNEGAWEKLTIQRR